jgi:ABC-type branched-subunit amino acid transport system substrate-binding protein
MLFQSPSPHAFTTRKSHRTLALCGLVCVAGCDAVLGLSKFSVHDSADAGLAAKACTRNADCSTAGDAQTEATDHCVTTQQRCARLLSADCQTVTGPMQADDAILIGSLLSVQSSQASLMRQRSALLAVEEINAAGGIPSDAGHARPLVLLSCDASEDVTRAATHLIADLDIHAIVGPDSIRDPVPLATKLAIPNGVLMISPTLSPADSADLSDNDLLWTMVPNDLQRAALMIDQVKALESALKVQRDNPDLKLSIVTPEGAVGASAISSLNTLTFGGEPLFRPSNLGKSVRIDLFGDSATEQQTLVDDYAKFAPDIVVLLGGPEEISGLMEPLERAWSGDGGTHAAPTSELPHYLLTDVAKGPELLALFTKRPDLAPRVRGVGVTPASVSLDESSAFTRAYRQRFGMLEGLPADASASYDAIYALSLAIASRINAAVSGIDIAAGLRQLMGGDSSIALGSAALPAACETLRADKPLSVIGSLAPLLWDERGAVKAGTLDTWCVAHDESGLSFSSAGRQLDVASQNLVGVFTDCDHAGGSDSPVQSEVSSGPTQLVDAGQPTAPSQMPSDAGPSSMASDAGVDRDGSDHEPDAGTRPPAKTIACGPQACAAERGESCCVSKLRVAPDSPQPADFSCTSSSNATCAANFHCASDAHCGADQVCCGVSSEAKCVAKTECPVKGGIRLACQSSKDCTANTICCAHIVAGTISVSAIDCSSDCQPLSGGYTLCETDKDCVTPLGNGVCRASTTLPAMKLCQAF